MPKGSKLVDKAMGPKEADFGQSKERVGKSIGGLLGVGQMMMGRQENVQKSNAETELILFNRFALVPILRRIEPIWDVIVKKWDARLAFKFDAISTDDEELQANIAHRDIAAGCMSRNERRIQQGMPPSDVPGMNDFLVPSNLVPIQMVSNESWGTDLPAPAPADAPGGIAPIGALPEIGNEGGGNGKPTEGEPEPEPEGEAGKGSNGKRNGKIHAPMLKARAGSTWRRSAQLRFHQIADRVRFLERRQLNRKLGSFFKSEGARISRAVRNDPGALAGLKSIEDAYFAEIEGKAVDPVDPLGLGTDHHRAYLRTRDGTLYRPDARRRL
jgi:hypothetical protein